jgi:hypothetical protein
LEGEKRHYNAMGPRHAHLAKLHKLKGQRGVVLVHVEHPPEAAQPVVAVVAKLWRGGGSVRVQWPSSGQSHLAADFALHVGSFVFDSTARLDGFAQSGFAGVGCHHRLQT